MESLSSVVTIVRIAQDIVGAVATVNRNKSRCRKLARRVQDIGELLRELHGSAAGAGTTDAATRRPLERLEDALRRALQLVQACQHSSYPFSLLAGGRQADQFDEVDGDIDHCLLDLGVANRILIARLEKPLLHSLPYSSAQPYQHHVPAPAKKYDDGGGDRKDTGVKDDGAKDDDSKVEKFDSDRDSDKEEPEHAGSGETKDRDKTAAGVGAGNVTISVPVHMYELVPPPSYGYGYLPYTLALVTGAPSDGAAYYHHSYSSYPDMFSDENPNACVIM